MIDSTACSGGAVGRAHRVVREGDLFTIVVVFLVPLGDDQVLDQVLAYLAAGQSPFIHTLKTKVKVSEGPCRVTWLG